MFDKVTRPSLGEDLRKGAIAAFLICVVAPAIFGVAAASTEGNKAGVAAELREAKQSSLGFAKILGTVAICAVSLILLFALLRLGLLAWFISMVADSVNR